MLAIRSEHSGPSFSSWPLMLGGFKCLHTTSDDCIYVSQRRISAAPPPCTATLIFPPFPYECGPAWNRHGDGEHLSGPGDIKGLEGDPASSRRARSRDHNISVGGRNSWIPRWFLSHTPASVNTLTRAHAQKLNSAHLKPRQSLPPAPGSANKDYTLRVTR